MTQIWLAAKVGGGATDALGMDVSSRSIDSGRELAVWNCIIAPCCCRVYRSGNPYVKLKLRMVLSISPFQYGDLYAVDCFFYDASTWFGWSFAGVDVAVLCFGDAFARWWFGFQRW